MSLTQDDLLAIKGLIDTSIDERVPAIINERVPRIIDERVPGIIDERVSSIFDERLTDVIENKLPAIIDDRIDQRVLPLFDKLEKRLTHRINQLALDIDELVVDMGQFSLETTQNFALLTAQVADLQAASKATP